MEPENDNGSNIANEPHKPKKWNSQAFDKILNLKKIKFVAIFSELSSNNLADQLFVFTNIALLSHFLV